MNNNTIKKFLNSLAINKDNKTILSKILNNITDSNVEVDGVLTPQSDIDKVLYANKKVPAITEKVNIISNKEEAINKISEFVINYIKDISQESIVKNGKWTVYRHQRIKTIDTNSTIVECIKLLNYNVTNIVVSAYGLYAKNFKWTVNKKQLTFEVDVTSNDKSVYVNDFPYKKSSGNDLYYTANNIIIPSISGFNGILNIKGINHVLRLFSISYNGDITLDYESAQTDNVSYISTELQNKMKEYITTQISKNAYYEFSFNKTTTITVDIKDISIGKRFYANFEGYANNYLPIILTCTAVTSTTATFTMDIYNKNSIIYNSSINQFEYYDKCYFNNTVYSLLSSTNGNVYGKGLIGFDTIFYKSANDMAYVSSIIIPAREMPKFKLTKMTSNNG